MPTRLLIFVFERVSYGRERLILAEFAPVPNVPSDVDSPPAEDAQAEKPAAPAEFGGPQGPEPTRFGDWEKKGRCVDF